jgi:putative ABC transport system ATP-binding protein
MQLTIKNLLPEYFEEDRKNQSEIWGKEIQIDKGEFIKIVAPSGSGKTSLTHFIYGLRQQYKGSILFDDREVKQFTTEQMAIHRQCKISVVLQDMRLFDDLTVFENINIKRQLQPRHNEEKIKEMAERLGIGNKLSSKCGTCSYGEQQRVAIIRSLMQPFDFLLLDEPFSHLDNENAQKAMTLMLEEAKLQQAAIIFADLERIDYFPYSRLFHL